MKNYFLIFIGFIALFINLISCTNTIDADLVEDITEEVENTITVTEITLDGDKELFVGQSHQLKAIVLPENATDKTISWVSDKPEIANVDASGKVTALTEGTAIITAVTENLKVKATATITVSSKPLSEAELFNLEIRGEVGVRSSSGNTINVVLLSANAEDLSSVSPVFEISAGATVDVNSGVARDFSTGPVQYIVTAEDGITKITYTISIEVKVTGVGIFEPMGSVTLNVGQTLGAIIKIVPFNASNQKVIWSTDNPSIATVDIDGEVTAVSVGSAIIKVTTEDGSFSDTTEVEVLPLTSIDLSTGKYTAPVGSMYEIIVRMSGGAIYSGDIKIYLDELNSNLLKSDRFVSSANISLTSVFTYTMNADGVVYINSSIVSGQSGGGSVVIKHIDSEEEFTLSAAPGNEGFTFPKK